MSQFHQMSMTNLMQFDPIWLCFGRPKSIECVDTRST